MLLSVHSKSSRLAVLGELGRYPLFVRALTQCLAYKSSLTHKSNCSMAGLAMQEMADMAQYGNDCWLSRVQTIEKHIKLPSNLSIYSLSRKIYQHIKSRFDIFWPDKINNRRLGPDGNDHNKLRTYCQLKGTFDIEPYLVLVRNRNQRCNLTRLRISSHCLGVELLRYSSPPVPLDRRCCRYYGPGPRPALGQPGSGPIDTELHAVTQCSIMNIECNTIYQNIIDVNPIFLSLIIY